MISNESRIKMGWRKGKTFTAYFKKCEICENDFKTVPTSKKQFCCSKLCKSKKDRKWPKKQICQKCGKEFLARKKEIRFCSRGHSTRTKTIRIRELRPKLLENSDYSCQQCGWNKEKLILEVHHKDRNQKNNDLNNLIVLCPNCHEWNHLKEKTGRHRFH